MKYFFLIGAVVVAVAAAGGLFWYTHFRGADKEQDVGGVSIPTSREARPAGWPTATDVPAFMSEGGPAVDPVSLPAFAQRQFEGSDFTVGQMLADNEAYRRHYITYKSGGLTPAPEGPVLQCGDEWSSSGLRSGLRPPKRASAREGGVSPP